MTIGIGHYLTVAACLFTLGMSVGDLARAKLLSNEYVVLLLLSVLGMMLMISAGTLISLYLGLELQSLALYVVAAIDRGQVRSSEAGLKYFVLGSLSSGMLLYGASLIYGFTGSTDFSAIAASIHVQPEAANIGLTIGLVFLLVGLAFKISAVPFHMALGLFSKNYNRWENNIVQTAGTTAGQISFLCWLLAAFDILAAEPGSGFDVHLTRMTEWRGASCRALGMTSVYIHERPVML